MKTKPLQVGGIGTGVIFNHAHLKALVDCPEIELVGVYDRDSGQAEKTRVHYLQIVKEMDEQGARPAGVPDDIRVCRTAAELYGIADAVDICTHPKYHPVYAVEAMQHNCHVMTEKPMCRTWLEADYVHRIAKETGRILQLNDDNVFLNRFRRLKNIVESAMVGPVQHVWIARGKDGLEGPDFGAWFWNRMEGGGGSILDYGSHALTAVWFVLGFDKVAAEVRSLGIRNKFKTRNVGGRIQEVDIDDDAHFKVRFVDPQTGDWQTVVIEATWSLPELGKTGGDVDGYLEIECSEGTIAAANNPQTDGRDYFIVRHRAFGERHVSFPYEAGETSSFATEVLNFARCVRDNCKPVLSAEEGEKVLSVLNAAQLSEMRGRANVTPGELKAFSCEMAAGEKDIWKAADAIVEQLTSAGVEP